MKKKVLIVYHYIALYREAVFKQLIEDKTDFNIASDTLSNNDIELISINSLVYKNKFHKLTNQWLPRGALWQKGLLSLIVSNKYDRIIFLGDPHFITTWFSLILCKFYDIKTYIWSHGFLNRTGKVLDTIKLLMYKVSDGVLLYGNESKVDLIEAGIKLEKLHVIYNSLDYEKQKKLREDITQDDIEIIRSKLFKNSNLLQLVFIGRLTTQKKLGMIVTALKKMNKEGLKFNMLFIGEGPEKVNLEKQVNECGLNEFINFYGKSYNEDELAPLICSSDICVAPGEIGLTAMHSLGYGTPVITHNNRNKQMPEFEAVIQNKTGMLFEEASIESLMDTIISFQSLDLTEVRVNCINIIEQYYTPQAQVKNIKKAIGI